MRHASSQQKMLSWVLAGLLIATLVPWHLAYPASAFADAEEAYAEASAAQQRLEDAGAAYDEAVARVEQLDTQIAANEFRIAELEKAIPLQQQKTDVAYKALYKLQQEGGTLVDFIMSVRDFSGFLKTVEYIIYLQESNLRQIQTLADMKTEVDSSAAELAANRAQAEEERQAAEAALAEAQAAREAAQAAAEAARQAEAEAAAAAAAVAAEEEKRREEAGATNEPPSEGNPTSGEVSASPGNDGADWSSDKDSFVASWASRLDSYLSGSPLHGYGSTFAAAAWDYGIDPRFSAAISCVESSKGRYCFRSHNAWGWGSISWDSWEEAINAHARGLSRGYGYTVTVAGAQKYCPPNWEFWYSRVCAEMSKI